MGLSMITVRTFQPDEAHLFRAIRLEALLRAPDSFGSTHAEEAALEEAHFRRRLENDHVWGAFDGETCVGMAGFEREGSIRKRHKGTLRGMYVAPEARGLGAGEALVQAVLEHAAGVGVQTVLLTVKAVNLSARRLYERMGFAAYGVEPRSLHIGDDYFDDVLMHRDVRGL